MIDTYVVLVFLRISSLQLGNQFLGIQSLESKTHLYGRRKLTFMKLVLTTKIQQ